MKPRVAGAHACDKMCLFCSLENLVEGSYLTKSEFYIRV